MRFIAFSGLALGTLLVAGCGQSAGTGDTGDGPVAAPDAAGGAVDLTASSLPDLLPGSDLSAVPDLSPPPDLRTIPDLVDVSDYSPPPDLIPQRDIAMPPCQTRCLF